MATPQSEIVVFLAKLAEFHATLSESEQAMLDDLTAAAFADPDVEGFDLPGQPGLPGFTSQLKTTMFGLANDTNGQYYYYYYRPQAILAGNG
jgi:hypothetical protein